MMVTKIINNMCFSLQAYCPTARTPRTTQSCHVETNYLRNRTAIVQCTQNLHYEAFTKSQITCQIWDFMSTNLNKQSSDDMHTLDFSEPH